MLELERLPDLVGTVLGTGSWREVSQDDVDAFAAVTGDDQWIHTDPERAAHGPFGTTVVHGYLTLALLPVLSADAYRIAGVGSRVNAGLDRVRFLAPVPVGSRVRNKAELVSATHTERGIRIVVRNTVEVEGAGPACIADTVTVLIPGGTGQERKNT